MEGVLGVQGQSWCGKPQVGKAGAGGGGLPLLSYETGTLRVIRHPYYKVICFSRTKGSFSCSPLGFICFCGNMYCIEEPTATCLEAELFIPPSLPTGRE